MKRQPFWWFLSLCFLSAFLCSPAFALDRDRTLSQLNHTAWTARDGAPSQISALAQTQDGYLWIGSARGLFRFDGVEFEPYVPPQGVSLPGLNIIALQATPDGGLWIAFRPFGLAFLKDGRLRIFSRPEELPKSEVFCLASDLDGRVWAGTLTGLALFDGDRWLEAGSEWSLPNQRIWAMFADRDGTLWVAIGYTIVFLPRGSKSFQQTGISTIGVPRITQGNDGRLWMTQWASPVRTIPIARQEIAANNTEIQVSAHGLHFDRDGSLWLIGSLIDGVKRVRFPEALAKPKLIRDSSDLDSYSVLDGLTDNTAGNILEDREGNIWISSTKGLDRFSRGPLVSIGLPPTFVRVTLLAGEGGDILVASANRNPLLRISGEKITKESVPFGVASFFRDSGGIVWWGSSGGIWKQNKDRFDFFPQPVGLNDWFWEIFPDDESGGLWAGLGDIGLVHFKDGVWTTNPERPKGLREKVPSASFKDPQGKIWLGYNDGTVCFINGKEIQTFSRENGLDIGRIKVIRSRGTQAWFGGEIGLAVFNNDVSNQSRLPVSRSVRFRELSKLRTVHSGLTSLTASSSSPLPKADSY